MIGDETESAVTQAARDMWAKIAETFYEALRFDPQWHIANDHSITWWPNFLSQVIEVDSYFLAGENLKEDIVVKVKVETPICLYVDQHWAEVVCHGENTHIPYGAFVAHEGLLKLTASICVSQLNFEMCQLLHEISLVHVAAATKLAYYLTDNSIEGVTVIASEHPESGVRAIPDQLSRLFLSDQLSRSELFDEEMDTAYRNALPIVKDWFLENGYTDGWKDEDVFFIDHKRLNYGIGIGFPVVREFSERYGPGLQIMSTIFPAVLEEDVRNICNELNLVVREDPNSSQLGPIYGVLDSGNINIRCYLGTFYLQKCLKRSPEALVAAITNAMIHVSASTMRLNEAMGISPKSSETEV